MRQADIALITEKVQQIYDVLNITKVPIDPERILHNLGIDLIKYSELPMIDIVKAIETSMDGFCGILKGRWTVFYNDSLPVNRIRFTLMHELGHIALGHTSSDVRSERQANMFSSFMLMPREYVVNYLTNNDININSIELASEKISTSFMVSREAARIAIYDIKNRHLI
ncbi:MAG: ImmA/IrrE family metallo-endopeptidase [Clostridia bacterium]|nr:ImmA/IrrE family metallo-endopeptidase [Clostridia bacterium]